MSSTNPTDHHDKLIARFISAQIPGRGNGTRDFVPTINLVIPRDLTIAFGIYGAWVSLRYRYGVTRSPAAMHYGPRPIIHDNTPSLEMHILTEGSFDSSYNPQDIDVEVVSYVREIRNFADPRGLLTQIQYDIQDVLTSLGIQHS